MRIRPSHSKVFAWVCSMLVLATLACSLQKTATSSDADEKRPRRIVPPVVEQPQIKALTAQEIIEKSTEAMKGVDTMSLDMVITTGSAGISIEMNGEGVIQQPDKAYLKMDYAGQVIEVLDPKQYGGLHETAGSTTWQSVDIGQINQPGG